MAEALRSAPNLLDSIQVGFLVTDSRSNVLFANRPAEHLLGYHRDEIMGQPIRLLFLEEDVIYFLPNIIYLTRYESGFQGEVLLRQKGGEKVFAHLATTSFREGDELFLTFSLQAIEGMKRLEREKQEAERWAVLGRMVEEIAHQIRNPVVSVGGYANRLLKSLPPNAKSKSYLFQIVEEAKRLEGIIQRMEEYVRMPRLIFRKEKVMEVLNASVQAVLEDMKNQGISFRLKQGTIKENGDFFVDRELVIRSLCHILRNSLEAITRKSPPKGRKVVEARVSEEGDYYEISISDNGEGIAKKYLPQIFEPFYSIRPDRVGLGLTFVKRVIEEHRGTIRVASRLRRGTTVTLSLPKDRRRKLRRKLISPEVAVNV